MLVHFHISGIDLNKSTSLPLQEFLVIFMKLFLDLKGPLFPSNHLVPSLLYWRAPRELNRMCVRGAGTEMHCQRRALGTSFGRAKALCPSQRLSRATASGERSQLPSTSAVAVRSVDLLHRPRDNYLKKKATKPIYSTIFRQILLHLPRYKIIRILCITTPVCICYVINTNVRVLKTSALKTTKRTVFEGVFTVACNR